MELLDRKGKKTEIHFLPENVRYALTYRKALLGKSEILSLIKHPYFDKLGAIFALKSLPFGEQKQEYLSMLLNAPKTELIEFSEFVIPSNTLVKGAKAKQYSVQVDGIEQRAQDLRDSIYSSGTFPLLVAHSTLTCLHIFKEVKKDIGILFPKESFDAHYPIGYLAKFQNDQYDVVSNLTDEIHNTGAGYVGIDDTRREGNQGRGILSLFNNAETPLVGYDYFVYSK